MDYEKRAKELFLQGYNCAQATFITFAEGKMKTEDAARIASAFGGGLAGTRNVCGAVSGMAMAYGLLRGYCDPSAKEDKLAEYKAVKELTEEFEKENGSIICRDLLGLDKTIKFQAPSDRSGDYYQKRPCPNICACAAKILARYLEAHKDGE
jgi:C_GCAxxG_C_C family probable redox protein